jgi:Transcriptional regulatory protein, C terminal
LRSVQPGRVFSRAQLLDGVWGHATEIDDRTVDVQIGEMMTGAAAELIRRFPRRNLRAGDLWMDRASDVAHKVAEAPYHVHLMINQISVALGWRWE